MSNEYQRKLNLKVFTSQGTWEAEVDSWSFVRDLLDLVMRHFNYATDGYYEIEIEGGDEGPLKLNRPLESYPISDDSVLILTDLGVAV